MSKYQLMDDELKYLEFASKNFQKVPVLIDVGMDEGRFSQEFIDRFSNCIIFGFEPIQESIKKSRDRFKDLLFDRVFIYNFLLGSRIISDSIIYKCSGGCSSIYVRKEHIGIPISIPSLTLDIFCYFLPEKIDYVKLDVEGEELNILKGTTELLKSKRIQYIQFEINDEDCYNRSLKDVGDFLNQYQYIIRNDNLDIIKDFTRPYNPDVQNYLAELIIK